MAAAADQGRWNAEFEDLGRERVRSEVMLGHWHAEKRKYARQWLEHRDVEAWQTRVDSGGGGRGLSRIRINRRLLGLISGVLFGASPFTGCCGSSRPAFDRQRAPAQYLWGGSLAGNDSSDDSSTSSHFLGGSRICPAPAGLTGVGTLSLAAMVSQLRGIPRSAGSQPPLAIPP